MHHFVQSTTSNGDLPAETGALPSAPQSQLDLTMDLPHLGNPFTSPSVVKSCRQSPLSSLTPAVSIPSKAMSGQNESQWVGATPPRPFSGGLPPCWSDPLAHPQTVSHSDLSFCILFQNFENIPNFETSFKTFPFLLEKPAASHSLDQNEPPQEKHPTLRVTLDCGYESGQGFGGRFSPGKSPFCYHCSTLLKLHHPQTLPFVGSRKTRGRPRRHGRRGIVGGE